MDFLTFQLCAVRKGESILSPKFIIGKKEDLMVRGRDFYAVWDEENGLWSTDENVLISLIDAETMIFYEEHKKDYTDNVRVAHMWDSDSGVIDKWHKYVQKQLRDNYHPLDEHLIFSNTKTSKSDYATKRLPYALEEGDISAYDQMMSTLYSPEERHKIEWAIGAIVSGDSKDIQKFLVLYGSAGTGKSTILNIIQWLFDGYYAMFDAKALGNPNDTFALEAFKTNPLVAIQHDGDLSRIEDNTRLNSLVSHEMMTVNEKFKSLYSTRFNAFLFMGTNKPVRITDAKSGIIRRLIDVSPTGEKLPNKTYIRLMEQIKFELGAIAWHCLQVYKEDTKFYDNYIPLSMIGASNDFYNFVLDSFDIFEREDGVTLKIAWEMYKNWCEDAKIQYVLPKRAFKEELKNYFETFDERKKSEDGEGSRPWNYYGGFKEDKFIMDISHKKVEEEIPSWLEFSEHPSALDILYADCPAQIANSKEKPAYRWDEVTVTLKDIDTSKVHYLRPPDNLIVIDFDLKGPDGKKDFKLNYEAASKWPKTYAELSKSGEGIHLHYIYNGDVSKLKQDYAEDIEVKVFTGKSSLRRKLTRCNDIPVNTLNIALPTKEKKKMVSKNFVVTQESLRKEIIRNLNKEIHPSTAQSVSMIFKILEDAYNSGIKYDLTPMKQDILDFAFNSTHQSANCIKMVSEMHFKSDDAEEVIASETDSIIFFDVEVFPNLFVLVWKGIGSEPVKLINPTPMDIENLCRYRLVGFNNKKYDNQIIYARMIGYSNEELYQLSKGLISNTVKGFREADALSYTDIYDFASKKQSLKKFEIELGIHHEELGLKWDEPVPEELWLKVANYCVNDVIATEAVWNDRKADFAARKALAALASAKVPSTVNDSTNTLTTRLIFGRDSNPQKEFNYRDLAAPCDGISFPGYEHKYDEKSKRYLSTYRGDEVGEGGYVYANPGMYGRVKTYDVASMHPHSITAENLFGDRYTKIFADLMELRIAIKHKDYEKAKTLFDGAAAGYLSNKEDADSLSQALKIAINSVYGLTSAGFKNPFRDPRNVDNIVAKRGALFMVDLKNAVQEKGYFVVHIKTDSIKVLNPDDEIENFIFSFGKKYGYDFEIEAIYDRICLVNDAVYIARYAEDDLKHPGEWTATGTQFKVPYVFKKIFSKQPIEFEDLCETKSVTTALYLDMNEGNEEEHDYKFVGKVGSFCPIKPGCGGGLLVRETGDKFTSATGAKGYRWLESETVRKLDILDLIDLSYYDEMVEKAVKTVSEFGDIEIFKGE